jgi:hypothetical protein
MLVQCNGLKNITVQKDRTIILTKDIQSQYFPVEQLAAFKTYL